MASAADLAGEEAPTLVTIGQDGAVFYWIFEAPAAGSNIKQQSNGYPQIPNKHRKRKQPESAPFQPAAAATAADDDSADTSSDDSADAASHDDDDEAADNAADNTDAAEASDESDAKSGSDVESGGDASDDADKTSSSSDADKPAGVASDGDEDRVDASKQASTSGQQRAEQPQQQQTLSYAGEHLHLQMAHRWVLVQKQRGHCPVQVASNSSEASDIKMMHATSSKPDVLAAVVRASLHHISSCLISAITIAQLPFCLAISRTYQKMMRQMVCRWQVAAGC